MFSFRPFLGEASAAVLVNLWIFPPAPPASPAWSSILSFQLPKLLLHVLALSSQSIFLQDSYNLAGLPRWLSGEESICQCKETQEMGVQSLGWEDPLEEKMATYSSLLA